MSSNPSPAIAALLSFLFPGLGQVYAGEPRRGVLWAIPTLLLLAGAVWLLLGGSNGLVAFASISNNQVALLVLNVAFFCYHLAAMIDAYGLTQRDRLRRFGYARGAPIALALVVGLTIVLHGLPEVYGIDAHNAYVAVVHPGGRPDVLVSFVPDTPRPSTSAPATTPPATVPATATATASGSPEPTATASTGPSPTRSPLPSIDVANWPSWAQDGRLNVLLVGSDSRSDNGVGAVSLRTDSMILLSVDIESGKAALFSFPRNLCTPTNGTCDPGTRYPDWLQIKLPAEDTSTPAGQAAYPDGNYDNMLNALWKDAASSPNVFQGSPDENGATCQTDFTCERGWRALVGTLQIFTGQQIDGVIAVNLKGFVALIANLPGGGIWLDIPAPLSDDAYYNSQQQLYPVNFAAGCQFLDPEDALAYARSRHQDSDYQRERRQQFVLQSIRKQLDPMGLLPHIPALLQVAQDNLFTTFGDTDISYLAQVAARVDADRLYREDFAPAHLTQLGSMQAVQDLVTNIFSQPEPEPAPTPSNPANACPPRT